MRAAAAYRLRSVVGNGDGATDIGSIKVCVLVLVGGIFVITPGIIAWAQERGAKQDLVAIVTAEQAAQSDSTLTELLTRPANLVSPGLTSDTKLEMGASSTKYWAVAKGGDGKWFGVTNTKSAPSEVTAPGTTETTAPCEVEDRQPLILSVILKGRLDIRAAFSAAHMQVHFGSKVDTGCLSGCSTRCEVGGMTMNVAATKKLRSAVEASDFVAALKEYGVSQADIATVVKVDPKTVYSWKARISRPRVKTYTRLDGLREVVGVLSDSLSTRGVGQWLHAPSRLLESKRPLDALREGKQEAVLQAARSFVDGSYV
ncbi:hypothetical protein [Arthrobacter sp. N1]|uniref:hypothetical protein n=1 Tax=Arthrobacter sp. N1 TaxID=619291 RepID=UPI003BB1D85A